MQCDSGDQEASVNIPIHSIGDTSFFFFFHFVSPQWNSNVPTVVPVSTFLFSNPKMLVAQSHPTLMTPWTTARQASLSMEFSRQEY